jgi:hypothetical protein
LVTQESRPLTGGFFVDNRTAKKINPMPAMNKKVDAYIAKSADFARPVLQHLRKLVHAACPEVAENIKWSFPCFDYKGPFCSMAAFKGHCSFGFWKTALIPDPKGILSARRDEAMGSLGKITGIHDLPPDKTIIGFIKAAKKLNDEGIKLPARKKAVVKEPLVLPGYFRSALQKNKKATAVFEAFSYSQKKEYLQWVTEAKTETTRLSRLQTAIEWIAEGKIRNWKYQKK